MNSMDLVINEYKKHLDESLLLENLKRTVEQRIEALQEMAQIQEDLQAAMAKHRDKVR